MNTPWPARWTFRAAALFFILAPASVRADGPYLHGFDAIALLPPPPALRSPEDKVDRETAFRVYSTRTPEEIATAKAEHKVTIFAFAPAIGPSPSVNVVE